jgi:hypothetical protein
MIKNNHITRYSPTGVGKFIGGKLYLHMDYLWTVPEKVFPRKFIERAVRIFRKKYPQWRCGGECFCNCVKLDLKSHTVRFDEAADFNFVREPHVGRWFAVDASGVLTSGFSNSIWHHKHLWVTSSYFGFSVEESESWSAKYLPLIEGTPKSSDKTWAAQLKAANLT